MKRQRLITPLLVGVAFLAIILLAFTFQVCRDWAFVCENTGTRKGYREWIIKCRTRHWYQESPLERFIRVHEPKSLVHRWTSYAGTGRNIFGMRILHGHGAPGAMLQFDHDTQRRWIAHNAPNEVQDLHELLASGDQEVVEKRITAIREEVQKY